MSTRHLCCWIFAFALATVASAQTAPKPTAKTEVKAEVIVTSGAIVAKKATPKPAWTPAPQRPRLPAITKPPAQWSPTELDPAGVRGWFSVVWSPLDRLPQTPAEWQAWIADASARNVARHEAALMRSEEIARTYAQSTRHIVRALYLLRLIAADTDAFADKSLSTHREVALRTQLAQEVQRLQPALERVDETRAAFAIAKDPKTPPLFMPKSTQHIRANTAPSRWWLAQNTLQMIHQSRYVAPLAVQTARREAATYHDLLLAGIAPHPATPTDPATTAPQPYVPYDTPIPLEDAQLTAATAPPLPVVAPPANATAQVTTETLHNDPPLHVVAAAAGIVELAATVPDLGITVIIAHPDNLYTIYSNLDSTPLATGQRVSAGETIGTPSPLTGRKRGFRFDIRHNDKPTTNPKFNPCALLQTTN